MNYVYETLFLDSVNMFIHKLPISDQAKVAVTIICMREGDFHSVYTKVLRGEIKELIVRKYRFIFFIKNKIIYFVGAFIKKSQKTPKIEIMHAEKILKLL